jgi:tetratricopeptide (TPR) repeat protein
MDLQGPLWEGVLPGVLRQLYVGRRTGLLVLSREAERRSVRFYVGNIANAETNVREDRLGELLVRLGRLSERHLKEATGIVLRDGKRLGQVLVAQGRLDPQGLREAMALHVDTVLSRALEWSDGQYEFREEIGRPLDEEEMTLPCATGDLILRASHSVRDPDVVRYRLGDIDRVVGFARDPLVRFQRLSLSAVDACVLSRVDGRSTGREIVRATGMTPEDVRASLFALLSTGVIEYLSIASGRIARVGMPDAVGASPKRPPSAAPARGEPSIVLSRDAEAARAEERVPLARPDATATGAVQALPRSSPELEARRREILEAHGALASATYYELLGVPRDAGDAQIREAYFRRAKLFHPDAHHEPGLGDLREKLETLFLHLAEAYEVLRSPRLRARYERESRPPGAGLPPGQDAADKESPAQAIDRAAESVARERYWEALPLLEKAVPRAEGAARRKGRVLLARLYARDPDWVDAAADLLNAVLKEEPDDAEVLFYVGLIHEHRGALQKALVSFRRVLELDPRNADARRRVAELGRQEL